MQLIQGDDFGEDTWMTLVQPATFEQPPVTTNPLLHALQVVGLLQLRHPNINEAHKTQFTPGLTVYKSVHKLQVALEVQVTQWGMRNGQARHLCEAGSKVILGFDIQAIQIVVLLQLVQSFRKLLQGTHWKVILLDTRVLGLHREQFVYEIQFVQLFINWLHNWHREAEFIAYVLLIHKVHWDELEQRLQNDNMLQELQELPER